MFEAFKIGITIALTNTVSTALTAMSKDFVATDAAAIKLHKTLNQIKTLGTLGVAAGGIGYAGFKLIEAVVKPANEYAHQLNIMNMAGLKHAEIAQAVGAAWKNTSTVITTTATDNLKSIYDMRKTFGDMGEAIKLLPLASKLEAVMGASGNPKLVGSAHDIGFSMAKALDIIGAVRDPVEAEKQARMMAKAVIGLGVTPAGFQQTFAYARQAKFDLSDEFKYEILPTLMMEMASKAGGGGGSKGVGPMLAAFYRVTNQGYINKKSLPEWEALGYVNPATALKTTTSGTTVGAMKDAAGAAANPFIWTQALVAQIRKVHGANISDEYIRSKLNELYRGNQLAASVAVEFFTKAQNFLRDQQIVRKTMGLDDAYNSALQNDPYTAMKAAEAQWDNFKVILGKDLVPIIIPAILQFAQGINSLAMAFRRHPNAVKDFMVFGAVLSGIFAVTGIALTSAAGLMAFKLALGFLLPVLGAGGTVALVVLGIGAVVVGAYEVYAHWDEIKPKLMSIWHGITDWLDGLFGGISGWASRHLGINFGTGGGSGSWGDSLRVSAPPSGGKNVIENKLYLDGRQIYSSFTEYLFDAANGPHTSGAAPDYGYMYRPAVQ